MVILFSRSVFHPKAIYSSFWKRGYVSTFGCQLAELEIALGPAGGEAVKETIWKVYIIVLNLAFSLSGGCVDWTCVLTAVLGLGEPHSDVEASSESECAEQGTEGLFGPWVVGIDLTLVVAVVSGSYRLI